jgi:hypothetical protein
MDKVKLEAMKARALDDLAKKVVENAETLEKLGEQLAENTRLLRLLCKKQKIDPDAPEAVEPDTSKVSSE